MDLEGSLEDQNGKKFGCKACESRLGLRRRPPRLDAMNDESKLQAPLSYTFVFQSHTTQKTPTMSPPRFRSLLDLAVNRTSYTCNSCTRTLLQQRTFFRPQQQQTRLVQTSQRSRQHAAPNMNDVRKSFDQKNQNTIYYTLSIILGTVALSYGSVPLYKTICQQTGWGGTPIKTDLSQEEDIASKLTPITSSRR